MIPPWPTLDPEANKPFDFDLSEAVALSPLESYAISISGSDSALEKSNEAQAGGIVRVWLGYPTEGVEYIVTCHFKLLNGFEDDISRTITGAHN